MDSFQRRLVPSTSALVAFEAVARLGSFSAAAQHLNLTQGAVSRQISVLEGQLGVLLFERNSRGVDLTPNGVEYASGIREALGIIRASSLDVMHKLHGGILNLAITATFGTRWLMPRIGGFIAAHKEVTLNFATRGGAIDFEREQIDAAVIHVETPNWPHTQCTLLITESLGPVCSPTFLKRNPITGPQDMLALPLLNLAARETAWDDWFGSLGLKSPGGRAMQFELLSTAAQACTADLGIALLPLFLFEAEFRSGELVLAHDHIIPSPSAYYLAIPKSKLSNVPVTAFKAWLLDEAATFVRVRRR
jgi:LysR family transcriptional regulator, glycine cleavage system transcriptional activator